MVCRAFQIFIDSSTNIYYPNSTITGRVLLELNEPEKARGVKIKFVGRAKVEWSKFKDDKTEHYGAREDYIPHEYYQYFLIGSGSSEIEIPAGEHVYPFSTTLPPNLPTSFEGKHGNIRYYIKAVLDRPWKFDEEVKLPFIIEDVPIDLNRLPQVKEPVRKETSKAFCCLCCKSGPLTLAGSIPCSGFVPGQTFVATIEVDNASNVQISSVKCKLIKDLKWIAHRPSTKEEIDRNTLVKVDLGGVGPHESKSWIQNIEIPLMHIINLYACTIIRMEYYLQIEADPAGAHMCLEMKFPITLGTVPLFQTRGTGPAPFPIGVPLYPAEQPSAPNLENIEAVHQ